MGWLNDVVRCSLEARYSIVRSEGNSPRMIQLNALLKNGELLPFITYEHMVVSTKVKCTKNTMLRFFADRGINYR